MQTNIYRVPGSVRRSLHRGVTSVAAVASSDDFANLTPYLPIATAVAVTLLYDGDVGLVTGIGTTGGSTSWDTGYLGDWTTWVVSSGPLSRFVGAT